MKRLIVVLSAALLTGTLNVAVASGGGHSLAEVEIPNTPEARQRGAEIATNTCMMCHSFKYIKFRDLMDIGLTEAQVDAMRGDRDMEERLESMTPLEVRKESYGKVPPDLSLMTLARKEGPRYVYTLLTSYYTDEEGNGDNHLFPGIRMPDMLGYSFAGSDKERAEIEATVKDVVAFLNWAADPNAETRRTLGVYVIIYLIIMTTLLYLMKKRVWRKVAKLGKIEH